MPDTVGLALSGGGAKVAFHLGVLQYIDRYKDIDYDVVSGTSAGALAGVCAAAGRIDILTRQVQDIGGFSDIYGGGIGRFVWQLAAWRFGWGRPPMGVYNMDPLRRRLKSVLERIRSFDAVFYPTRVRLRDGNVEYQSPPGGRLLDILASASIPIFAEPVRDDGELWVDGGTRDATPLKVIARRHSVDHMIISNTRSQIGEKEIGSVVDVAEQTVGIMTGEIFKNDMNAFLDWNDVARQAEEKGVEIRHPRHDRPVKAVKTTVIEPSQRLPSGTDFSPSAMERSRSAGQEAARKAFAGQ